MTVHKLKIKSTPYTYVLEWTKEGKRYIGSRCASGCHPDDLWSTYFTSSKYVDEFVKNHGSPDIILIDKTFDNAMDALNREQELQHQFDVINNKNFINKNIAGVYDPADPEIRDKKRLSHTGSKKSSETKEKMRQSKLGKPGSPSARKGKHLSVEHAAKVRVAFLGKNHTKETRQKMSESRVLWWKNKSLKENKTCVRFP